MKWLVASVLCVLAASGVPVSVHARVDRPPQFVAISFDNCGELERWQEWSAFLEERNAAGDYVRFTFFVSGTNFLAYGKRHLYAAPGERRGTAMINFGGSADDVRRRIEVINRLRARGHEIASHAVGHFDGKQWSAADWSHEFRAYGALLDHVAANNGLPEDAGFDFTADAIVGFRAPYLSRSAGLDLALKQHRFRYDASGTGNAGAWPENKDGLWRFNLANLRLAGSSKYTLSMDYNFLIAQSGIAGNPRHYDLYREQMLRTYLDYFRSNYSGTRAPVHIGHHFSNYQGGVYNEALKDFARIVCGLPEVRCATYAELADFLDGLDPSVLTAYQSGNFPRGPEPVLDRTLAHSRTRP